ncbi:SDR family NAD(P)-dependent oxidoreductase [Actinospica acidithermotolerans]|uniref:SDR family NAD(P)-dependent oxidoreductase n=1 Tax=Actinospica acidithermotolerans TaxID=2828514 RepID=UPI001BACA0D3|nr:SDR family NAD(P)-dependent oxidoreductase [Actinospica acidithermotolerans]
MGATKVVENLSGRTVLVTGASSGLGFAVAKQLAGAGARTLLACRDAERAGAAIERIRTAHPAARAEFVRLDLASLESVEEAAAELADRAGELDVLVNNAGVMAPPPGHTPDGFEVQIGVNHLGHFALTGHLLPLLLAAEQPRVVTVTSVMHKLAVRNELTDFKILPHGSNWLGYGRSKLANLMFAFELDRRAHGRLCSIAAHPGVARSDLMARTEGGARKVLGPLMRHGTDLFAQSADQGARPILFAATAKAALKAGGARPRVRGEDPDLTGTRFFGPRGPGGLRGAPTVAGASGPARDPELCRELWVASAEATGVRYAALG